MRLGQDYQCGTGPEPGAFSLFRQRQGGIRTLPPRAWPEPRPTSSVPHPPSPPSHIRRSSLKAGGVGGSPAVHQPGSWVGSPLSRESRAGVHLTHWGHLSLCVLICRMGMRGPACRWVVRVEVSELHGWTAAAKGKQKSSQRTPSPQPKASQRPWEGGRKRVRVDVCSVGRSAEHLWGGVLKAFIQN